jgi:hypothetical protein
LVFAAPIRLSPASKEKRREEKRREEKRREEKRRDKPQISQNNDSLIPGFFDS